MSNFRNNGLKSLKYIYLFLKKSVGKLEFEEILSIVFSIKMSFRETNPISKLRIEQDPGRLLYEKYADNILKHLDE